MINDALLFSVYFVVICTLAFFLPLIAYHIYRIGGLRIIVYHIYRIGGLRKTSFVKTIPTPRQTLNNKTRTNTQNKPNGFGAFLKDGKDRG